MALGTAVTVGHCEADFSGQTHRVLQAAVDYVASLGGGTVQVLPGVYRMGNAVHLRDGVRLIGSGEESVLLKDPSRSTRLLRDMDWYEWCVTVEDPWCFEAGGGCLLRSEDPHGGSTNVSKHTVLSIDGNVLRLDSQPRKNMWITHGATASTLFPIVTANWAKDIAIQDIALDGNRAQNEHLDGNYGGCIFLQDCERVQIARVVARNNQGDGISWQICHDVTVEDCVSEGHRDLGLHPGSGSLRPAIRRNAVRDCRIGLFWCWGVKNGTAEGNEIHSCSEYGISIGHRDTDNVIRENRVYDSGKAGLYFRPDEPSYRCAHRNQVESNLFEGAGKAERPGVGIDVAGAVDGVVLRENRIVNPPGGHLQIGIRIAEHVTRIVVAENEFTLVPHTVVDLRLGDAARRIEDEV
jgi:parallel beta-helix repeat protein